MSGNVVTRPVTSREVVLRHLMSFTRVVKSLTLVIDKRL